MKKRFNRDRTGNWIFQSITGKKYKNAMKVYGIMYVSETKKAVSG